MDNIRTGFTSKRKVTQTTVTENYKYSNFTDDTYEKPNRDNLIGTKKVVKEYFDPSLEQKSLTESTVEDLMHIGLAEVYYDSLPLDEEYKRGNSEKLKTKAFEFLNAMRESGVASYETSDNTLVEDMWEAASACTTELIRLEEKANMNKRYKDSDAAYQGKFDKAKISEMKEKLEKEIKKIKSEKDKDAIVSDLRDIKRGIQSADGDDVVEEMIKEKKKTATLEKVAVGAVAAGLVTAFIPGLNIVGGAIMVYASMFGGVAGSLNKSLSSAIENIPKNKRNFKQAIKEIDMMIAKVKSIKLNESYNIYEHFELTEHVDYDIIQERANMDKWYATASAAYNGKFDADRLEKFKKSFESNMPEIKTDKDKKSVINDLTEVKEGLVSAKDPKYLKKLINGEVDISTDTKGVMRTLGLMTAMSIVPGLVIVPNSAAKNIKKNIKNFQPAINEIDSMISRVKSIKVTESIDGHSSDYYDSLKEEVYSDFIQHVKGKSVEASNIIDHKVNEAVFYELKNDEKRNTLLESMPIQDGKTTGYYADKYAKEERHQTLFESINRTLIQRCIQETVEDPNEDLIFGESIEYYTMLETLHTLKIFTIGTAELHENLRKMNVKFEDYSVISKEV